MNSQYSKERSQKVHRLPKTSEILKWVFIDGIGLSPFPPSGNGGYIHNLDVPYLSVTTSYVVTT